MWNYEKRLIMPIEVNKKNLHFIKVLITQYGGPFGELGAALRYLNQRYTMPTAEGKALLTDIGTEELGHVEMICAMCYKMMEGATIEEIKAAGLEGNYSEHGMNFFP
ncbi:MAG: manganese catalase family protein, partial [bacterium]